jgi:hypothetical protein
MILKGDDHLRTLATGDRALKRLGLARDGLLIVGATLYGAGYVSWSFYAWVRHLGPVPAFESQYFIAGVPVVIVILAGWRVGISVSRFYTAAWPRWFRSRPERTQWIIAVGVLMITIEDFSFLMLNGWSGRGSGDLGRLLLGYFGTMGLGLVFLLFRFPGAAGVHPVVDKFANYQASAIVHIYITMTAVLFAVLYLVVLYPKLPQSFGGAAPRPALLDVLVERLPESTIQMLAGRAARTNEKALTSVEVAVYREDSQSILISVKTLGDDRSRDLIELKQESLAAIHWIAPTSR